MSFFVFECVVCSNRLVLRWQSSGRGKKAKGDEKQGKLSGVVHVRAKRGQATDSHSLAERVSVVMHAWTYKKDDHRLIVYHRCQVRREKINERLRCLQDIVPGCYKVHSLLKTHILNDLRSDPNTCWNEQTMGMAVMLDEIINYVQSLQNQVEVKSNYNSRWNGKPDKTSSFALQCSSYPWNWPQQALFMTSTQRLMPWRQYRWVLHNIKWPKMYT